MTSVADVVLYSRQVEMEATNGGFPNMEFQGSNDYNQMQMMMAMQNGMAPNSFGGFPMMGKSRYAQFH